MANKSFIVDFDVTVDLAGVLKVNTNSEEEAQRIAKQIIRQCLEKECCDIEIESETDASKYLEIEKIGNVRSVNIMGAMNMES